MATIYTMRALHTPTSKHVSWTAVGSADLVGTLSGYNPSDLSEIVVDYTASQDFVPITNDAPQFEVTGDLSGPLPNPTVIAIQGNPIQEGLPSDGYVLTWDELDGYWEAKPGTGGGGTPGGFDTHVQFNDAGSFAGDAGFTYDKTTNVLSVSDALAVGTDAATTGNIRLPNDSAVVGRNSLNTSDHNIFTWNNGVLVVGNNDASSTSIIGNNGAGIRGDSITFSNTNNTEDFARFTSDGLQIGSATPDFGGGSDVIGINDASVIPTTNPTGGVILYSEDSALKYRKEDGTIISLDGGTKNLVNIMAYWDAADGSPSLTTAGPGNSAITTKNIARAIGRALTDKIDTKEALGLFLPPAVDYGVEAYSWGSDAPDQITWSVHSGGSNVNAFEFVASGEASKIILDSTNSVNQKWYIAAGGPAGMGGLFRFKNLFVCGDNTATDDCLTFIKTSVDLEVLYEDCTFYACQNSMQNEGVIHGDAMGITFRRCYWHGCTNSYAGGEGAPVTIGTGTFGALFDHCNWYTWERSLNPFGGTNYSKSDLVASFDVRLLGGGNALTSSAIKFLHCTWAQNARWGAVLADPGSLFIDTIYFDQCNVYANNRKLFKAYANVRHTIVERTRFQHNSSGDASIDLEDDTCERLTLRQNIATHSGILFHANTGQTSVVIEDCTGGTYDLTGALMVDIDESSTFDSITLPAVENRANVAHEDGIQIGSTVDFGGGVKVIGIDNATTNPSTNPTSGVVAYVDAGDGYLKYRKADGTVINLNGAGGGGGSFTAGGDLSGTSSNQTVTGIQSKPVSSTTPTDSNILQYSSTSNQWRPVDATAASSWETVYEVDFSALPTQSFSGNGDVTIDGRTWTVENFSAATSAGIVNGTGLRLACNTTSTDYVNGTRSSLLVKTKFRQLFPAFDMSQHKVRISLYFTHNADENFENTVVAIEDANSPTTLSYSLLKGTTANGWQSRITQASSSTTNGGDTANITTDNVIQFTFYSPTEVEARTGAYSSGFPSQESTNSRRKWTLSSTQIPYANSDDIAFMFSALTFNAAGNFISTAIKIKVEVLRPALLVGSDGGWSTVYDRDFSSLPTQSFSGNGNVTIDGKTWTVENFSAATSFGVVATEGLKFVCNTNNTDYINATRSSLLIKTKIKTLIPNFDLSSTKFRATAYFTHNVDQNFENFIMALEDGDSPTSLNWTIQRGFSTGIGGAYVSTRRTIAASSTDVGQTTDTGDNVFQIQFNSLSSLDLRSGVYSGGFPAQDALRARSMQNVTNIDPAIENSDDIYLTFSASTANTSGNLVATIVRLKVEVLSSATVITNSGYNTFANRPTAGIISRRFVSSDGPIEFVDTGSEWKPIICGKTGKEVPVETAFTLVSASGLTNASTLIKEYGVLRFSWTGNGSAGSSEPLRLAYKSAPTAGATGYRVTVHAQFISPTQNGGSSSLLAGLGWRNSSTGSVELMEWAHMSSGLSRPSRRRYTASGTGATPTFTFSAQTIGSADTVRHDIWMRIERTTAGARDFYVSYNGTHWHKITATGFPSTSNEFFTPDQVFIESCIFGEGGANAGSLCGVIFDSYEEEAF